MIDLSRITLCAISSVKIPETLRALEICNQACKFNRTVFFSDQDVPYGHKIKKISSVKDYNQFAVNELPHMFENDEYVLTIHWDGFIINKDSWTDKFYEYDYIGSPWPWMGDICGNGGFCLKSHNFFKIQKQLFSKYYDTQQRPEDLIVCYYFRNNFLNLGCKYAPPEIAYKFAIEHKSPKYPIDKPFGFHDFKWNPEYIEKTKV